MRIYRNLYEISMRQPPVGSDAYGVHGSAVFHPIYGVHSPPHIPDENTRTQRQVCKIGAPADEEHRN